MEEEKLEHLDEAIRHSMEVECDIRNTRTNWFLVFQAALGGGLIQLLLSNATYYCKMGGITMLSIIGIAISVSFIYAAWRSDRAISMLFAYWDQIRSENGMNVADYYPISPINEHIISSYYSHSYEEDFETSVWEHKLAQRMNLKKHRKWNKFVNKFDCLMPYKFLPKILFVRWIIVLILIWKLSEDVLSVDNIVSSLNIINCR